MIKRRSDRPNYEIFVVPVQGRVIGVVDVFPVCSLVGQADEWSYTIFKVTIPARSPYPRFDSHKVFPGQFKSLPS